VVFEDGVEDGGVLVDGGDGVGGELGTDGAPEGQERRLIRQRDAVIVDDAHLAGGAGALAVVGVAGGAGLADVPGAEALGGALHLLEDDVAVDEAAGPGLGEIGDGRRSGLRQRW